MKASYLNDLEDGLGTLEATGVPVVEASGAAVIVSDALGRRLVEAAAAQIGLPVIVFETLPGLDRIGQFELVIADEADTRTLREGLSGRERHGEGLNPGLVAVRSADPEGTRVQHKDDMHFEGVLAMPLTPSTLASQLSVILYAHRAFARRYETALEELHLNRRIFRSVTSGISVANASLPDLPLVYVNPAFEVMTGYCLEEVQGKNCRFLQGAETDPEAVKKLREAIRDHCEVVVVLKNFRKDGRPFWNELSLSPIRNREGELTHFVGIQTDVTARVDFEAALRESEKLAAVGRLASSIAHEINNPLESVMNLLYLAQEELAQEELGQETDGFAQARRYVMQADKELRRVALITSQSLRFYKQSTKPHEITAEDLLESVVDMYEGRAVNADVRVARRERATGALVCLESEIRQVLSNLVRNALDAMRGTGGTLAIRTRDATDWASGRVGVMFTIADQGTGIAPETLARMFKPFFTTKGIAGTGLGLWISREIVERHEGRLKVRSRVKAGTSGTVFCLFLPRGGTGSMSVSGSERE